MKVYLSCSEECSNSTPCSQPRREAPVKNSDAVQITSSEVSVPLCISYLRVRRSAMYAQHGSAGVHQRHAYNLPRHTKSRQHSHGKNICVLSLSHTHSLPPPPMSNFCFFIATSTACICRCTLLLHRLAFHFDSTAAHEQARRVPLRHFEIVSLAGYLEKGDSAIRIMRGKNEKRVQEREFNRRNKCAS